MSILYPFHSFIRKYLGSLERIVVAAGLSFLVYSLFQTLPVYPLYWDGVIVAAIFFLMLWSPVLGYFAAVLAVAYPLYTVSLYLAVLFMAIAVIGQHIFIHNLGATLITLLSPLLGGIYLAWGIPLLGGLWWGPAGGALMGAFAALWGQLAAGMAGLSPDWVILLGYVPDLQYLAGRFASANSLETFRILLAPLAPDSTTLLYHGLQVAAWAFTGWLVGMLAQKEWVQYRRPRSTVALAAGGTLVIALLQAMLSYWLGRPISPGSWMSLGLAALFSSVTVVLLELGQDFFEHPLPVPQAAPLIRLEPKESKDIPPEPVPVPNLPEMGEDNESDDLIMLELD